MATFDELSSKIEQVVFKCLSDSQEETEDNIRNLLAPLVNNKETLELRKLTLEHVIKKIAMRYSVCSFYLIIIIIFCLDIMFDLLKLYAFILYIGVST